MRDMIMQHMPTKEEIERDYHAGYARVMRFAEQAHRQGWRLTERQLAREITHRERAAEIREKSSLPIVGPDVQSAAWHRGQADALRAILRGQREKE